MNKIEVTSKTGKTIQLANTGSGVIGSIIEMGLDLATVDMVDGGVRSRFPLTLGGKKQHVTIQFSEAEMAQVAALFAEMAANVEMTSVVEREYAAHTSKINRAMSA